MKSFLFLHVILFTTALLSGGCMKESPIQKEPSSITTIPDGQITRIRATGSITGVIMPSTVPVTIRIYDRLFSSENFYYLKNGDFRMDGIPAGIYTVDIINNKTSVVTAVSGVRVQEGQLSDIGRIQLRF